MTTSAQAYPFAVNFPSRTFVGEGVARLAGAELAALGVRRPGVVTSRSVRATRAFASWLGELGDGVPVFSEVAAHTPRESVLGAARHFRDHGCDGLVSFGGGSAIDTAKGVALALGDGVQGPSEFDRYMSEWQEGGRLSSFTLRGPVPPHVVIPTTLSGAAHTASAGISVTETGRKFVHRHPALGPRAVLLDPAVTLETPAGLWAGTGMKALEHAVEAMYSRYVTLIDAPLRARAFAIFVTDLVPSVDPAAPDASARRARLLAGAAMSLMSTPPFGISHALGHQAGAAWSIAHAHTTSIFLPVALSFNAPAAGDALTAMAAAIGRQGSDPLGAILEVIEGMAKALALPRRLRDVGVSDSSLFPQLAAATLRDSSMIGNPRPATAEDVVALLQAAL